MEGAFAGFQHLGRGGEIHALHLGIRALGTEALCLLLHLLRQSEAVDPILEARVIIDHFGQSHLSAGGEFLQHQGVQPGPGGVEGCCVAARAAAHHDHIIDMDLTHGYRLLTLPELPG